MKLQKSKAQIHLIKNSKYLHISGCKKETKFKNKLNMPTYVII